MEAVGEQELIVDVEGVRLPKSLGKDVDVGDKHKRGIEI